MSMIFKTLPFNKQHFKLFSSLVFAILLALPPLVNVFVLQAHAATLTSAKVNIGDSRAGVTANHTFQFVTPTTTNIKTITFQYCTTASGSCTAPAGMVLSASPTLGTVAGIGGTTYTPTSSSGTCTGTGNSNCTLTLTVTTPAAQGAGSTVIVPFLTGITNPTTINSTYYVIVTTKDGSAVAIDGPTSVAFAILDTTSIAVSATVDPNFTFSIARATTGTTQSGTTPDVINVSSTTNNSIPFGNLNSTTASVSAHDVTVTTNASNGYQITASSSATPPLVSGSNDIDSFTDAGGTNAAPAVWSNPAGTTANTDTGLFGYTTSDTTLCTGTVNRFTNGATSKYAGFTTTGGEVACSSVPVSSDTTRVSWKLGINAIQPSGAYTGTIILVATPTY
jgi:hypothetical protein